uniref:(northern house mosquito) hypothetical protein n=1 Tax=Culex pipiens TaxID=7175 RepID=A0A8D8BIW0_CULPI
MSYPKRLNKEKSTTLCDRTLSTFWCRVVRTNSRWKRPMISLRVPDSQRSKNIFSPQRKTVSTQIWTLLRLLLRSFLEVWRQQRPSSALLCTKCPKILPSSKSYKQKSIMSKSNFQPPTPSYPTKSFKT